MNSSVHVGLPILRRVNGKYFLCQCLPAALTDISRYVTMDYIFFSSLRNNKARCIVISYDVVCQWFKKLWHRMKVIPHHWQVDHEGKTSVVFLIPKFHLPSHIQYCHNNFSWNLTKRVGRTDGECPERGWSVGDPLASSVREMGPGQRRDVIDGHIGDRNHKKVVGMGEHFQSRLRPC
jgi:hypothetical protein